MCVTHQNLLISQANYTEQDPWQALIIACDISLFQGISRNDNSMKKLDYNIRNIEKLDCLACERPDLFGELVEASKSHNLTDIKDLGEKWIGIVKEETQK